MKVCRRVVGLVFLCAAIATQAQAPKTIEIQAKRYAFVPDEITVVKGQPVELELVSDDVPHSLRIDGLDVNLKAKEGETAKVEITPQQTGDFQGRCGIFCGSGHGKMLFTVHVVDAK